jgi:ABC-type transport system substrate-binding protein
MLRYLVVLLALALCTGAAGAQEKPRTGGELVFAVPVEAPSYDGHREGTFGIVHPAAPHYNTLLRVDPTDRTGTRVVGDLAQTWTITDEGRTYTLKLRKGVKFHDGSEMTARDAKASYDKIINPPGDTTSFRKAQYDVVETVETPDPSTIVFRLKWPSASFLTALASPFNWIYKADILARDIRWYEKNVMGTGPFVFVEHQRGSHWVGKKNPNYWDTGKPYLDGYRALFIKDSAAQVAAVRGERAHVQFRGFTPGERDSLVAALGPRIVVQESPWDCVLLVTANHEKKPFDDKRVRRALTLALDRYQSSQALSRIAIVKLVGGVQVPGTPFATPPSELEKLAARCRCRTSRSACGCSTSGARSASPSATSSRSRPSGTPTGVPAISRWSSTRSVAMPWSRTSTSTSSCPPASATTTTRATPTPCSTSCTASSRARSTPRNASGSCASSSGAWWTRRRITSSRSSGIASCHTAPRCGAGRSPRVTI